MGALRLRPPESFWSSHIPCRGRAWRFLMQGAVSSFCLLMLLGLVFKVSGPSQASLGTKP